MLSAFAAAGLPVVIVGEAHSRLMYRSDVVAGHSDGDIAEIFAELVKRDNVKQVKDYSNVPSALAALGVQADATYSQPADVLSAHRTDESGDYYYLYNYNKMSKEDVNSTLCSGGTAYPFINKEEALEDKSVTVTLKGEGKPYLMNAWDGSISAIPVYESTQDGVKLTLDLSGDEAVFIALLTDEQASANGIKVQDVHATAFDCTLAYDDGRLVAKSTENGTGSVTLSNGSKASAKISGVQEAFDISSWKLKIDYLEQGESTLFSDSVRKSTDEVVLDELKGWKGINDEWESCSGVGTYTATFELDRGSNDGGGAYIDLGEVEDTYTVEINGHKLPYSDLNDTLIDIGEYTVSGTNTVVVKVASTLYNRFISSADGMLTTIISVLAGGSVLENTSNGLLGTDGAVKVIPYSVAEVAAAGGTRAIIVGCVCGAAGAAAVVTVTAVIIKRRRGRANRA